MALRKFVIYPCLALTAACGTSRSTRSTLCSNIKTVVDQKVAPQTNKNYDPSAALLLFKASSDKLTLESRCNARLVNKLNVKHTRPDGTLEEATAPIQFDQLKLQLESGEDNLELHTSAHCFFRIWDSRSNNQLKNNPAIGIEPVRSLLQNLNTRYQLYKSMLTTPQTLIVYTENGTPVTFRYTLQTAPIYERFFAEVDKYNSRSFEAAIGRELSKSSILLDELVLHECRADEKIISRLRDKEIRHAVKNEMQFTNYLINNKGNESFKELLRTRAFTAGRQELCFSQTDMVVAPIRLAGDLSGEQRAALEKINRAQAASVDSYDALVKNKTSDVYIAKIESGKPVVAQPTPPDLESCSYSNDFPAYSISNNFIQSLEKRHFPRWNFNATKASSVSTLFDSLFPKYKLQPTSGDLFFSQVTSGVRKSLCGLIGKVSDSAGNCTIVNEKSVGRCPSSVTAAETYHPIVARSLQIASTSPLHMLKRLRDESPLALTLPLVALRDFVQADCGRTNDCSPDAIKLNEIFSILDSKTLTTASGLQIAPTVSLDGFSITKYDDDHQFHCALTPRANRDQSDLAFQDFSEDSEQILAKGISGWEQGSRPIPYRFGARFLYLKCVAAGYQRLYNNDDSIFGLAQNVKFLHISFVQSEVPAQTDKFQLSNEEMISSGVPQKFPFARLFYGDSALNESSPELAARLLSGPHIRVSDCNSGRYISPTDSAQSGVDDSLGGLKFCSKNINPLTDLKTLEFEFQNVPAHLTFMSQLPNWLPERERAKYGPVIYPADNFSADSARYFFTAGDSGTTISAFGLFPIMMLSTVEDRPVSGGLAVIPTSGGQQVQGGQSNCK